MRSIYYATVRGKMSKSVGGIRRYCRKVKYKKFYDEAKVRADELIKYFKYI